MELDHERLDVYHLTLDFLVLASEIIEGLPRGRSHLSDQFSRASLLKQPGPRAHWSRTIDSNGARAIQWKDISPLFGHGHAYGRI